MYKIVNNNITITRGETATYNVRLIDKATGAPFILPRTLSTGQTTQKTDKFMAVFSVRKSDYIKDGYAIKKYLWLGGVNDSLGADEVDCSNDIVILNDTEIYPYPGTLWDKTTLSNPILKVLYKREISTGIYDYRYWNGEDWIPYEFVIRFPFLYQDTSTLSPKAYKYAMTIYGGNNLELTNDGLIGIDYKKPLVDAQFIVEADINE